MGKNQHSKDQLYITQTEWKHDWGGKKTGLHLPWKTLPYDCCAISFRPFDTPMGTADGSVFDLTNIVPYLKKFKRHPVTGAPLAAADLIRLHFHKNKDGQYHCPVLFKVFNQHTHIVAIKPTGNVYSHEAVKELNLKAKCMRDLIDQTPFTRDDIVTLQDPSDGSARELTKFSHVTENLRAAKEKDTSTVRHTHATERVMQQIREKDAAKTAAETEQRRDLERSGAASCRQLPASSSGAGSSSLGPAGAGGGISSTGGGATPRWLQTTGACAAGFTSTTCDAVTVNQIAALTEEEEARQRYDYLKNVKKQKGYCQLQTSHGAINIELHVDLVPMTCENFVRLCERGYYRGLTFHRVIRNFMMQGGDPTGTGGGGESSWGAPFKDEISGKLKHEGRGILSMANSGPGTNGSQFFITFKSAAHLDGKHSIFGRVVGGLDVLAKIEKLPTDKDDRPTGGVQVTITGANVFVNPFENLEVEMAEHHRLKSDPEAAKAEAKAKLAEEDAQPWFTNDAEKPKPLRQGIGKYIAQTTWQQTHAPAPRWGGGVGGGSVAGAADAAGGAAALEAAALDDEIAAAGAPPSKKAKRDARGFGDFSGW